MQILNRNEMKSILAGNDGGCMNVCEYIAQACFAASTAAQGCCDGVCRNQLQHCTMTCFGLA